MKQHKYINEEIQKTMEAYSETEKPKLNPYFTSKLKARIEAEQTQTSSIKYSFVLKLAAAIAIILINSFTVINYLNNQNQTLETQALNSMETQYTIAATDLYAYTFE